MSEAMNLGRPAPPTSRSEVMAEVRRWDAKGPGNRSCDHRGSAVELIRPGDRVFFEPGEEHWHGASATRLMTHIAIQETDDSGSPVTWGKHVTDEEYAQAPSIDA